MDNVDKIRIRLEKLREFQHYLKEMREVTGDTLRNDIEMRCKAERFLELAVEACVDIAELLIIDQRLPTPEKASEAITILGDAKILDSEFAKEFSGIAGFRNILAHDYLKIDYDKVADKLNNHLDDFDTFSRQVAQFLS